MTDVRLSAIVPTRGRPDLAAGCVQALLGQSEPVDEILVVDQSDDDATFKALNGVSAVRTIRTAPRGLSAARNFGLARAEGDVFAFVDDDCWPLAQWARGLRATVAAHPEAAAVFGPMLRPAGIMVPADVDISTIDFPRAVSYRGRTVPHLVGLGGNMALTHRALELLGPAPFDTRLGAGAPLPAAEDTDFIYRLLSGGGVAISTPDAPVEHHQWRGSQVLPRHFHGYSRAAGAYAAGHLLSGDVYALRLIGDLLLSDVRFIASALRRRSRLRLVIGSARLAGTLRGLARGPQMARVRMPVATR